MRSAGPTLSAGEAMVLPFTATRPPAIQASASRREQSPARAITLAIRSPAFCRCPLLPVVLALRIRSGLITEFGGIDEHGLLHGLFHGSGAGRGARGRRGRRGAG